MIQTYSIAIEDPIVEVTGLNFYYGSSKALHSINLAFPRNQVTALIGPSGCGKSTFLRCLNRMNDLVDGAVVEGSIRLDGAEINTPETDIISLRRRVGMVFQKSNPFPKSIYENVIYGLRIAGVRNKALLDETVEKSLKNAALWDEVKDRLHESAPDCPADRCSVSASPGRLRSTPRWCSWTNPARLSTPSRQPAWRI